MNPARGKRTTVSPTRWSYKLTVTVERIDGGKLRCTGATWTDAVVIFPGEVLAFQNIERQAHALRAPAPGGVVKDPPAEPDLGEDDFEGSNNVASTGAKSAAVYKPLLSAPK
jgi:hypothetical protein